MLEDRDVRAFCALLEPCTLQEFLNGPYGRRPHRFPAAVDAARALVGWDDVNRALDCSRAWDDRTLRLAVQGKPVPAHAYCTLQEGTGGSVWRPAAESVMRAVRAGAALVASGIDSVIPVVGDLAQGIEKALPVRVQANLYVSSAGKSAFPRHEDSHDVLVVHLSGRKRWSVRPPASGAAAFEVRTGGMPFDRLRGEGGGALDFCLAPRDLLYLPQGWSHEVHAETDGCMHLSFALVHLSLDDIARVLVQRLIASGATAGPLYDLHSGPSALSAHVDTVMRGLRALCANESHADDLLRGLLNSRRSRGHYALPSSAVDAFTSGATAPLDGSGISDW